MAWRPALARRRGPRARPGFPGRLLALGHALALFGLLLAGAVLLRVLARAGWCSPRSAWDSSSSTS